MNAPRRAREEKECSVRGACACAVRVSSSTYITGSQHRDADTLQSKPAPHQLSQCRTRDARPETPCTQCAIYTHATSPAREVPKPTKTQGHHDAFQTHHPSPPNLRARAKGSDVPRRVRAGTHAERVEEEDDDRAQRRDGDSDGPAQDEGVSLVVQDRLDGRHLSS